MVASSTEEADPSSSSAPAPRRFRTRARAAGRPPRPAGAVQPTCPAAARARSASADGGRFTLRRSRHLTAAPPRSDLWCVSRRLALCGILARRADADEKGELASALTPARRGQAAHSSSVPSTTTTASPPTPSITVSIRHANHRLVVERLGPSTTVSPLPSGGVCAKTSSSVWEKAARCSHPQAGSGVRRSRSP